MRAMVTGAAGFIGSTLADQLLADGHEVLGVDRLDGRDPFAQHGGNLARAHAHPRFELVVADLATAPLRELVEGCDAVFHLAGESGVRPSWGRRFARYARDNVLVTQRLLDASADSPERPVVYASSSSVYGSGAPTPTVEETPPRPSSPYAVTKLAGEQLCAAYGESFGVRTRILRLFTVYGPRQRTDMALARFTGAALRDEPLIVLGDGRQRRDFTFVQDVVAAALAAAAADVPPARAYNVGTGRSVSVLEAIALIAELCGRTPVVSHRPPRAGDVPKTHADPSRIRAELGAAPSTELRAGLAAEIAWVHASLRSPVAVGGGSAPGGLRVALSGDGFG